MLIAVLAIAILADIILLFHISIELNKTEKASSDMVSAIRKHYES
jgi:hypothetical protein